MCVVEVIASPVPLRPRPARGAVLVPFVLGTLLLGLAVWLAGLVFFTGFLDQYVPDGRPTTYQIVSGVLAWAFALTAPGTFALVGGSRLLLAYRRQRAARHRPTPTLRVARRLGDDHLLAIGLRIPDGTRVVPELVVGPFGVAVIEELPPAAAVMSRGVRSWEVRTGNGTVRTIENPLERAARDAERIRAWFTADDADNTVPVYAAVVGDDPRVQTCSTCEVVGPEHIVDWLRSLPPPGFLDGSRRERIVQLVRMAAHGSAAA
jgi:hypothetical protein